MINSKSFRRSLVAPLALICIAAACAAQTVEMAGRPNFTGSWRMNRELSDKPQEKVKEAVGKGGAIGRMIGGQAAQGKIQDRMKNLEGFGEMLRITHNDPEFQVSGNDDFSRRIFTLTRWRKAANK
jgi:hypothetical protein